MKLLACIVLLSSVATAAAEDHHDHTPSHAPANSSGVAAHVPPDPPTHPLPPMSEEQMVKMMDMDDAAPYGTLQADRAEWQRVAGDDRFAWDAFAYYGTDLDKAWLKTEGTREQGDAIGRIELLWDHLIATWWSLQSGVRHDFGPGPSRTWAAIGVQGIAPYFIDMQTTLYVGEHGRAAARLSADYDALLTQRWILRPQLEANAYSKDDRRNRLGSGLSDVDLGLQLRYEIRRELAPYVGVRWERKLGDTADAVRDAGDDASEWMMLAGVRFWF